MSVQLFASKHCNN